MSTTFSLEDYDTIVINDLSLNGSLLTNLQIGVPIGTILPWQDINTMPDGWKLCDGNGTYTDISGITRQIPDLRSKFIIGHDTRDTSFNIDTSGSSFVYRTSDSDPDKPRNAFAIGEVNDEPLNSHDMFKNVYYSLAYIICVSNPTISTNAAGDKQINGNLVVTGDVSLNNQLYIGAKLGIGTEPNNELHIHAINKSSLMRLNNSISTTGFLLEQSTSKDTFLRNTESGASLVFHAGNNEGMRLTNAGYLGIGPDGVGSNPKFNLDVFGQISYATYSAAGVQVSGAKYGNDGIAGGSNDWTGITTARFQEAVLAANFFAYSDSRIKTNIQEVNDSSALDKLRLLKPSLYNYIDVLARGENQVYGFLAQEVKEVIPDAVTQYLEFIPNIYSLGTYDVSTNIITIENENYDTASLTMDASNNVYKNIRIHDASNNVIEVCIEEIVGPKEIKIKQDSEVNITSSIFVYGQEVEDFHKLNKDAIFTVATSALQEVDRQLQAEKTKVATLETQLADVLQRLSDAGI